LLSDGEADDGQKRLMLEERSWLFAEKDEGSSNGRKRGALRRAISGKCGPGFA
jgi:hypothetical protein